MLKVEQTRWDFSFMNFKFQNFIFQNTIGEVEAQKSFL